MVLKIRLSKVEKCPKISLKQVLWTIIAHTPHTSKKTLVDTNVK